MSHGVDGIGQPLVVWGIAWFTSVLACCESHAPKGFKIDENSAFCLHNAITQLPPSAVQESLIAATTVKLDLLRTSLADEVGNAGTRAGIFAVRRNDVHGYPRSVKLP